MEKAEFEAQVKARGEEIKEFSELVYTYTRKIQKVQGLLKGSMIMAYRQGVIDMLDFLDQKAKAARYERDLAMAAKQDLYGDNNQEKRG